MATFRRRIIREKVLQALYAHEISQEPINDIIGNIFGELKSHKEDFEFAKRLTIEVIHHKEEIEERIKRVVAHWEFDRIALVDRMLLRMGICEMLYFPDIPPKVTINESIEVAKTFSTENSGGFINGVLDAIFEDLKSTGTLSKSGRGLIDESIHHPKGHPSAKPPKDT